MIVGFAENSFSIPDNDQLRALVDNSEALRNGIGNRPVGQQIEVIERHKFGGKVPFGIQIPANGPADGTACTVFEHGNTALSSAFHRETDDFVKLIGSGKRDPGRLRGSCF